MIEISASDLGDLFGLTPRRVQQLANQGVFVKIKHGIYDRNQSAIRYVDYKIKSEIERRTESNDSADEVMKERARQLRLKNDTAENLLVETDHAMGAVEVVVGMVRTALAGVPARVSDDVGVRGLIDDAIDSVLEDLSRKFEKASSALQEGSSPIKAD